MTARDPASPALRYLAGRARRGIKFGLDTMRALVAELGHPDRAYPSLLVAGTNGKGSVAAYVDAVLRASGLRVGRYTSPHLVRVHERIVVDGRQISASELESTIATVREAATRLVRQRRIPAHPTHFEVLTLSAFEHFRRRRVDVAVLEVGLGGRLDATNVSEPLASAIVSIDFDHEEYLGHTLRAIAREKAGVLRPRRVTVLGPLPAVARSAIARRARVLGARLLDAGRDVVVRERKDGLAVRTPERRYAGLRPLPGAHQRANLLVALRLLEEAQHAGLRVRLGAVCAALRRVRWPGRLQWLRGRTPLLLDGAHNPAGARALADHLRSLQRRFVLLFGAMRDKDVEQMALTLFPLSQAVVLTRPPIRRAATPREIATLAPPASPALHRKGSPARALALARRLAGREPVVVAGSLYLVGEVLRIVEGERLGRRP